MRPSDLVEDLLKQAHAQGIKEGELAEQAGLTPQGLSKAKARGDLRLSSLMAMGEVLGLELSWRPRQSDADLMQRVRTGTLFRFDEKPAGR